MEADSIFKAKFYTRQVMSVSKNREVLVLYIQKPQNRELLCQTIDTYGIPNIRFLSAVAKETL